MNISPTPMITARQPVLQASPYQSGDHITTRTVTAAEPVYTGAGGLERGLEAARAITSTSPVVMGVFTDTVNGAVQVRPLISNVKTTYLRPSKGGPDVPISTAKPAAPWMGDDRAGLAAYDKWHVTTEARTDPLRLAALVATHAALLAQSDGSLTPLS